jgi:hypothetical protein
LLDSLQDSGCRFDTDHLVRKCRTKDMRVCLRVGLLVETVRSVSESEAQAILIERRQGDEFDRATLRACAKSVALQRHSIRRVPEKNSCAGWFLAIPARADSDTFHWWKFACKKTASTHGLSTKAPMALCPICKSVEVTIAPETVGGTTFFCVNHKEFAVTDNVLNTKSLMTASSARR